MNQMNGCEFEKHDTWNIKHFKIHCVIIQILKSEYE